MSVLPVGQGSSGIDTGDIEHSLRFRSSASAYLSRTFGPPMSRNVWTLSLWIKRGKLGVQQQLFAARSDSQNYSTIHFDSSDKLVIYNFIGNVLKQTYTSTAAYRDPTSHLHIVVSANGSSSLTVYVDDASFSATADAANWWFNSAMVHEIGRWPTAADYCDGYLSRVCFVDGQALTPDSFGYTNEIGVWTTKTQSQVKAVVDAGGANSFMLDFDDATSLTTLGYDKSSKGNNWTCNNISLTAGVTYDHMLDVPGNSYATLTPLIPSAANISYANLRSGTTAVRATIPASFFTTSGAYWEVTAAGSNVTAGVISVSGTTNTTTVTANKVFGFRLTSAGNLDYINITDAGSWTAITTGLTGEQYPYGVTAAADWNFGQRPFIGTPSGQAMSQNNITSGTVTVSGTFTGNAAVDGPFVWMNGRPNTLSINGNAVTFGTHADKLANGFKVRTNSASYNTAGSNTWTATIDSDIENLFMYQNAQGNP